MENKKRKKKLTFKKANLVTWDEDEVDSNEEEEKDEEALLCLRTLDNEIIEVFEPNFSCSSDDNNDTDDLYHELYAIN